MFLDSLTAVNIYGIRLWKGWSVCFGKKKTVNWAWKVVCYCLFILHNLWPLVAGAFQGNIQFISFNLTEHYSPFPISPSREPLTRSIYTLSNYTTGILETHTHKHTHYYTLCSSCEHTHYYTHYTHSAPPMNKHTLHILLHTLLRLWTHTHYYTHTATHTPTHSAPLWSWRTSPVD